LRLSGVYLAIATLALSFVVIEVVLQLRDITGGAAGISLSSPILFGNELKSDESIYYLTAVVLGLVIVAVAGLIRSPIGQRWVAVRDSSIAAETSGVAVKSYKVAAFAISSAVAGVAGSLLAASVSFVAPFDYGLFFSIYVIVAVILGGSGSLAGAVIGAAFITLMPVALSRTSGLTDAIYGIALLLFLIVLPGGFGHLIRKFSKEEKPSETASVENQETTTEGVSDAVGR
jgi:branched-chain amino acid transport system permease protein